MYKNRFLPWYFKREDNKNKVTLSLRRTHLDDLSAAIIYSISIAFNLDHKELRYFFSQLWILLKETYWSSQKFIAIL